MIWCFHGNICRHDLVNTRSYICRAGTAMYHIFNRRALTINNSIVSLATTTVKSWQLIANSFNHKILIFLWIIQSKAPTTGEQLGCMRMKCTQLLGQKSSNKKPSDIIMTFTSWTWNCVQYCMITKSKTVRMTLIHSLNANHPTSCTHFICSYSVVRALC